MSLPNSPASDDSAQPLTPTSPSLPLASPTDELSGPPLSVNTSVGAGQKRKPSRRANTAERRATHNAVERQRRETLNGRFLDLAALLPNLSQIRRPSKSSIVNSSIAHVHASRRHRLLAARELRALKIEADALRRELNEWRDRAGIPRVDEPVRGEGFGMVISGELEVIGVPGEEEDYEDNEGGHSPDEYAGSQGYSRSPVIASPTGMTFENPAIQSYEPLMMGPGIPAPSYYAAAGAPAYHQYEDKPRYGAHYDGYPPHHREYPSNMIGGGGSVASAAFAMM